jgi:hypothetical protein
MSDDQRARAREQAHALLGLPHVPADEGACDGRCDRLADLLLHHSEELARVEGERARLAEENADQRVMLGSAGVIEHKPGTSGRARSHQYRPGGRRRGELRDDDRRRVRRSGVPMSVLDIPCPNIGRRLTGRGGGVFHAGAQGIVGRPCWAGNGQNVVCVERVEAWQAAQGRSRPPFGPGLCSFCGEKCESVVKGPSAHICWSCADMARALLGDLAPPPVETPASETCGVCAKPMPFGESWALVKVGPGPPDERTCPACENEGAAPPVATCRVSIATNDLLCGRPLVDGKCPEHPREKCGTCEACRKGLPVSFCLSACDGTGLSGGGTTR